MREELLSEGHKDMNLFSDLASYLGSFGWIFGIVFMVEGLIGVGMMATGYGIPGCDEATAAAPAESELQFTGGEEQSLGVANKNKIRSFGGRGIEIKDDFNQDAQKGGFSVVKPVVGSQADGDEVGEKCAKNHAGQTGDKRPKYPYPFIYYVIHFVCYGLGITLGLGAGMALVWTLDNF